jgi:hypothetical protein
VDVDFIHVRRGQEAVISVGVAEGDEVPSELATDSANGDGGTGGMGHRNGSQKHSVGGAAIAEVHDSGRRNPSIVDAVRDVEAAQSEVAVSHDARTITIRLIDVIVVTRVAVGVLHAEVVSHFVGDSVSVVIVNERSAWVSSNIGNADAADGTREVQLVGVA